MGWGGVWRWVVLGAALSSWAACSIRVVPHTAPTPHFARRADTAVIAAEDFDPVPYGEDLLLIEPKIAPPPVGMDDGDSAVGPETGTAPDSQINADELPLESLDMEEGGTEDFGGIHIVYRVQVIALRDSAAAVEVAEKLRERVSAAVDVSRPRNLHTVRAGRFANRDEAQLLRRDIAAMGGVYSEAYLVTELVTGPRTVGEDRFTGASASPAPSATALDPQIDGAPAVESPSPEVVEEVPEPDLPEPELVKMDGWRINIVQSLDLDEAERKRRVARTKLKRTDIDVIFDTPYHKVLVGHYRTADEAQRVIESIKRRGYPNALKVRAQVFLPSED